MLKSLVTQLTNGLKAFCLEMHFKDLQSLEALAEVMVSSRYACYCWTEFRHISEINLNDIKSIGSARFVFGKKQLLVNTFPSLPVYDWDEKPLGIVPIMFGEKRGGIPDKADAEYGPAIISELEKIVKRVVNEDVKVTMTTSGIGETRECFFHFQVRKEQVPELITILCNELNLSVGTASLELLGDVTAISEVYTGGRYHFDNFPLDCWSLNSGDGKTPFALERASFLYPLPNIDMDQLPELAKVVDSIGEGLADCTLTRKYVSWRLGEGVYSPRIRGS
jgi:hypothetical protein